MARTLMASRPYIFSSARPNLFLQSLPPLYSCSGNSFASPPLLLNRIPQTTLFSSCNLNHPISSAPSNKNFELKSGFFLVGHRKFAARATHVNDPGSIDSPLMQSMEQKIKEHLNAESVVVKDASGDGRHIYIDVVSSAFEGQSAVNRQRMVYKAIWEELQNTVHAVDQMTTRTPAEAAVQK